MCRFPFRNIYRLISRGHCKPQVGECDGLYVFNKQQSNLEWQIPLIDASTKTGSMEFSVESEDVDAFFPIDIAFRSPMTFSGLDVYQVQTIDGAEEVEFSKEVSFVAEEYSIV